MIFVDSNVLMYAVGRPHPLREQARRFFREQMAGGQPRLCTSAEVLQELLHAYLPVQRLDTLEAAFALAEGVVEEVWAIEEADVQLARALIPRHPGLGSRDLVHLACCQRRNVKRIVTFDRALAAAFA